MMIENCVRESFIHLIIPEAAVHGVTFMIIHQKETRLELFPHDALAYKNTNRN